MVYAKDNWGFMAETENNSKLEKCLNTKSWWSSGALSVGGLSKLCL